MMLGSTSVALATNATIYATKNKTMKATALGLWYVQIPSRIIVNPLGEIIEPRVHSGSKFILKERKRVAVSKLPKLDYNAAMEFKNVFC